ncbi:hypothetical protein ACPF7Z_07935 [Halomonas sp. GXIMD04776]|uniref:hypothetical protein n=1 Tax=Halomonas sp. GXIMD04776 TaxID=3415605 RepID=UPI003CBC2FA2
MKGLTLSAALLASMMAFSTAAIAQESSPTDSNSGVDSAQDVNPTPDSQTDGSVKQDDLAPNSGIDSGENVDPSSNQGSTQQLDQDDLAPNSGVDSANDVETGSDKSGN